MSRNYKIYRESVPYFISFATVGWVDVFILKKYADTMVQSLNYCVEEKGLKIHAWCLMTSHVHLIVSSTCIKLSDIIRDLKKFTSRKIIDAIEENNLESRKEWMLKLFKQAGENNSNNKDYQFWQQNNHPIEIYTHDLMIQKIKYIHQNPVVSGLVLRPEDYTYSSALDYVDMFGLVKVDKYSPI